MKNPEKNHDTGLRILEVLKILLKDDYTKNELIEKLKENTKIEGVYTQEAFLKYFNTFEHLGLKLKKNKVKYGLENAILKIDLTEKEKEVLSKLVCSIEKLNDRKQEDIAEKLILRLDKYVNMDLKMQLMNNLNAKNAILNPNIKSNIIQTLKNLIYDNQKVNITYKKNNNTEESIIVELKEIVEQKNNIYIIYFNNVLGTNKKINIDSIISLKQLPSKTAGIKSSDSVIFRVYGRLSSAYKIKEKEKLLDYGSNFQTFSNRESDKEALLLRLLKYGENCKIIKPVQMQKDMIELTNKILKNLKDTPCQE